MPTKLADYQHKYQCVRFERRDGILQMTLHTDGGPLRWGFGPHGELPMRSTMSATTARTGW